MTDGGDVQAQATFGDFGDGGGERPDGEAEHVAGNGGQHAELVDIDEERFPPTAETVEFSVTQVDYTVEGYGDDEFPVLHVFGRTATEEGDPDPVHARVYGFRPYFYTPLAKLDHEDTEGPVTTDDLTDSRIVEEARLTGVETYGDLRAEGHVFEEEHDDEELVVHRSIRDEELVKVFGQTPRDVGQLRDQFDHYEADILFPNRLLIDKDVNSGIRVPAREGSGDALRVHHTEIAAVDLQVSPRVDTFDIEVDDRSGFPEDGEEPIVCLTSHDSYDDEYVVWLYTAPEGVEGPDDLSGYEPIGEADLDVRVEAFDDEGEMLHAFVEYLRETDPDVLTGWNFEDFDMPYLIDRIDRLVDEGRADPDVLQSDHLSRVDEVWDSGWGGPNVKGRVVFDLLYAYKRRQFTELESYRLDAVGETELGVGKERYTGDIGDLWEQDPERLLEYNLRDVELCVEIDRRQDIVSFWEEVASFVGCKLEDATTPGDAVDLYILHEVHGDFALPSKGAVESEDYEGGAVFDPITGVRENVSVLDLKSLYPMCMVTLNLSPETYVADPEGYDGDTYEAPNGMHFRKQPDGIIREMVTNLLEERENKKALRDEHEPGTEGYATYDSQQAAVKVIMNSLYGVLGWDRFRLYDKDMGAAVTATGREVISFTEQSVQELGYEVAYGDTDSVMIEFGRELTTEEAIEASFELEESINASYTDLAASMNADEHRFQIEFEKLYRRFFQAGKKKRYAGHIVWKEGKDVDDIDITGFEYKRSDIAPITKEVQKEVIEMVVTGTDLDEVKTYVHDVIEEFQRGNVALERIGIPGGIGKRLDDYDTDTAQVRGAKYANKLLGTNFGRGSKPKRLYLERVHDDFFQRVESEMGLDPAEDALYGEFKREQDVICFEFEDQIPPEFQVDWDKMLDRTLKGPIERILEALDVSWEEVKSGQEQTGLGSFM
jgi:DNA polymerase I